MFRKEPHQPKGVFKGWTFCSSEEPTDATAEQRGLKLHDCLAILRVAPEVEPYLDLPPGSVLVRSGETTFAVLEDDATPAQT